MTLEIAVAIGAAIVALLVAAWLGRMRRSSRARRRATRAGAGEDAAADLLVDFGCRVIARQARLMWSIVVDGEAFETELIADYVVELGDERLVAEVKTGELAPRLTTAATRRQLLEYRVAFAVDGVLLVCPERGTIQRVDFTLPAPSPKNLPAARVAPTLEG